jgi:DNA primase
VFKDFKDAADAAKVDPENVRRTVAAAVPAPEFYFRKHLPAGASGAFFSTREGLQSLRAVLAKLKGMASPVERDYWMNELAKRTGIAEKTLREEAERAEENTASSVKRQATRTEEEVLKRQVSRQELIIEQLLSAALTKNDFAAIDDCVFFFAPLYKEAAALLKSGKRSSSDLALDAVIGPVVLRSSDVVLSDAEIDFLKNALAKEYYKERRQIIALAIKNAEANGNDAELAAALEELKNLPTNREDL